MVDGLSDSDLARINRQAGEVVTAPGKGETTWYHVHSGEVVLTIKDPTEDERLKAFQAQQDLRQATIVLAQLRQTARGGQSDQDKAALLAQLRTDLDRSAETAAPSEEKEKAKWMQMSVDEQLAYYIARLEADRIPHLLKIVEDKQIGLLVARYGATEESAEDPLKGSLVAANLAEWRLLAAKAEERGDFLAAAHWLMVESKWHNDRADYLRQKVGSTDAPAERTDLLRQQEEALTNRERLKQRAEVDRARAQAESQVSAAAYEAGLRYGQELEQIIARMCQNILFRSMP